MKRFSSYLLLVVFACLFSASIQKRTTSLYDTSKSNTLILNRDNFDKQITKHRVKHVSVIHFYKNDGKYKPLCIISFPFR